MFIAGTHGYAQRMSRVSTGLDFGTGFKGSQLAPSLLYYQALNPANAPWFQVSAGARIWTYLANDINLTAPANATQSDIMQLSRASATGMNFMVGFNVTVARKVDIGVNADILGFAFGKRRNSLYKLAAPGTAPDSILALNNTDIGIAPANLNIIPTFKTNNSGQAEAFVRIWLTQEFGVKAGYVWGQVAYRSDAKLNNGQGRFSSTYGMPFISLSIPLYN
jgi:hypothetical protein